MRTLLSSASLLVTSIALSGCGDSTECDCVGPESPSLQTQVGNELEADHGTMSLAVTVGGSGIGNAALNVSAWSSRERLQVAFGDTLSFEEVKALLEGQALSLPREVGLGWGESDKEVIRSVEQMSLKLEQDGSVTLTLGLGERLVAMDGASCRGPHPHDSRQFHPVPLSLAGEGPCFFFNQIEVLYLTIPLPRGRGIPSRLAV